MEIHLIPVWLSDKDPNLWRKYLICYLERNCTKGSVLLHHASRMCSEKTADHTVWSVRIEIYFYLLWNWRYFDFHFDPLHLNPKKCTTWWNTSLFQNLTIAKERFNHWTAHINPQSQAFFLSSLWVLGVILGAWICNQSDVSWIMNHWNELFCHLPHQNKGITIYGL